MYSEDDLEAAIEAGALSPEAAQSFRDFVAARQRAPAADEEHFRLVTGFNDIFVTIALVLVLVALGWLIERFVHSSPADLAVAAASWALAEYFTRRRRMALPSIVLLLSFVVAVFAAGIHTMTALGLSMLDFHEATPSTIPAFAGVAGISVVAAFVHWRRFRVPITVATGTAAAIIGLFLAIKTAWPGLDLTAGSAVAGLAAFALAMWWDMRDRARTTRRSDVAFWLHLLAAPLIVHPVFALMGLLGGGEVSTLRALAAVGVYLLLALVALAVDRRALLVSALAYVLYAISSLIKGAGVVSESLALTGLVIGSALLLLSAAWHRARRSVLALLPAGLRDRLPAA